jgi:protein-disulfide isomerase
MAIRKRNLSAAMMVLVLAATCRGTGCAFFGYKQLVLSPAQAAELGSGKYVRGEANAPVTLVEFADYQCPHCASQQPIVERLLKEYQGRLKLVFRDRTIGHVDSMPLAEATRCAGEQDGYWRMHDYLFRNQGNLDNTHIGKYAAQLGLDREALEGCIKSGRYRNAISSDDALADRSGVRGTPTYFVNVKMLEGTQSYADLAKAVDDALGAGQTSTTSY